METTQDTARRLAALHAASRSLTALVYGLSEEELKQPSYADGWSIAQVLSHLGSGAEISARLVERGRTGDMTGPTREEMLPVWARWDELPPLAQRAAWREADARHLGLLDSLDAAERATVRIPYFAGQIDVPAYLGYRLSEQSVHGWDVTVALDPGATVPDEEARLLWDRLDLVTSRFHDRGALRRLAPARVALELTDLRRTVCLDLGEEPRIRPEEPADPAATVTGTADAVLRLVYGRNRPGADGVTVRGSVALDDLRSLFPGF
ncbi:maleylpyruvate isomerase family mycothiol-dependent enzyme [Microbispora rosea]|uniref:maleylpyruvate isomerase family mycothiol-dependent enzyme n=1 Tax=Microbispora rosea TaxID=58117 RepID=UPI00344A192C